MDITIECDYVNISAVKKDFTTMLQVEIEGIEEDAVVKKLDVDDLLNNIDIYNAVNYYDVVDVLNEINLDDIKKYLNDAGYEVKDA